MKCVISKLALCWTQTKAKSTRPYKELASQNVIKKMKFGHKTRYGVCLGSGWSLAWPLCATGWKVIQVYLLGLEILLTHIVRNTALTLLVLNIPVFLPTPWNQIVNVSNSCEDCGARFMQYALAYKKCIILKDAYWCEPGVGPWGPPSTDGKRVWRFKC